MIRWQGVESAHPWTEFVRNNLNRANPTPEHYLLLLYILGARMEDKAVTIPVEGMEMSSISILSAQVG